MTRLLRAFPLLLLWLAQPASAQGSLDDLVGSYTLRPVSAGPSCPMEAQSTLEVRSVTDSRIAFAINGRASERPFDAQRRRFTFPGPGWTYEVGFRRLADSVAVTADLLIDNNVGTCRATLSGSKAAPPVAVPEAEAGGGGGAPGNAAGGGGDEPGDISEIEMLALLLAFVLLLLAGVWAGRKLRGPAKPLPGQFIPVPEFGESDPYEPRMDHPSLRDARKAVGSDRLGGYEDSLAYGEGAGRSSPAAQKAYEALIVAQGARETPLVSSGQPKTSQAAPSGDDSGADQGDGDSERGARGDGSPPPETR